MSLMNFGTNAKTVIIEGGFTKDFSNVQGPFVVYRPLSEG